MTTFLAVGQSITSVVSNTQRKEVTVKVYVDAQGYVQNAGFIFKPISVLEVGTITGPVALVLHRTVSSTSASVFQAFQSGIGTHFVVDKDGTVYQAASLFKRTQHVGRIRSRCKEERSCAAAERVALKKMSIGATYGHEKAKSYPARYPMNEDSVGIETVANYDRATKTWEAATSSQSASIRLLVGILKDEYGLSDADIYEHDKIAYKTPGEGADLYGNPVPPILPPRYPGP